MQYPETKKVDQVDEYFGVPVADPYRWLEDDNSEETAQWVAMQNELTGDYLSKIPVRNALKEKLTKLVDYERYSSPFKKNGKYYFFKNSGLQNQDVLYTQATLTDEPRVFLDPNRFSDDGTVALSDLSFSHNGKYLAYAISRSGSDWEEIFVIDLATEKLLDDHILWSKATGVSWQGDGFYYSAYDAPDGSEFSDLNENQKIYYHKVGDPQASDDLIYQNQEHPKRFCWAQVDEDERALFIMEAGEGRGNNLKVKALTNPEAQLTTMADNMENSYWPIGVIGNQIYLYTNDGAPNYKLMVANLNAPEQRNWQELVPEADTVLASAHLIGDKLILEYLQDASSHVYRYDRNGNKVNEIELPALGTASFAGKKDDNEAFFTFTSFTFPTAIYRYDTQTNQTELFRSPQVAFDPAAYTTEQIFFPSKDGTKVPMFLTYKKGLKKDGNNPTVLYGYGGFGINLTPHFSTSILPFLDEGGIWVEVNLRGGSEYGEDWHIAGTKLQKQNVFDDFISAAEYLIAHNYTNPNKLAIRGGSNGGLLVGAVTNQRPELFKVALPAVGVMDMLRYHNFTIGWNWASDYGTSADNPEMFNYLKAYSPLHNIKPAANYPATLITTADHDDRVVPAHSFKYAAALQAANQGPNPTLIRIETKSGHGGGKPITKVIDENADVYAFIFENLGM